MRGAAWRLDEQRWSMVEEHSEACFMWGSEKRRLTSLGVELRGDKDERRTWTSIGRQRQREVVDGG
jgi:hypothetical protein